MNRNPMRIAIFGATSEIAKDLINLFATYINYDLVLFARRPEAVLVWLKSKGLTNRYVIKDYDHFNDDLKFDAILNFVGVGNPAKAVEMGSKIIDITYYFDTVVLRYLKKNPMCQYIFMSSGAAYGSNFREPVSKQSYAEFPLNQLTSQDWYGLSKLYAETRHRSLKFSIVDIRIFNYFSSTQSLAANYFITDLIRAIKRKEVFLTSRENIVRDYIGAIDFYNLINAVLVNPEKNIVLDCYSKKPINKYSILQSFQEEFGLKYEFTSESTGINSTGSKLCYYSINYSAKDIGYVPLKSSLDLLIGEARKIFSSN